MKKFLLPLLTFAVMNSGKTVAQDTVLASAKKEKQTAVVINNPIIKDKYTGDPAALVYKDKVYLYAGHDEAPNDFNFYKMNEWLVYSTSDMIHWQEHPVPLKASDFAWAKGDAWASQVIERNGKFYWYVAVEHGTINGQGHSKML
jgi:beta-xylosidase